MVSYVFMNNCTVPWCKNHQIPVLKVGCPLKVRLGLSPYNDSQLSGYNMNKPGEIIIHYQKSKLQRILLCNKINTILVCCNEGFIYKFILGKDSIFIPVKQIKKLVRKWEVEAHERSKIRPGQIPVTYIDAKNIMLSFMQFISFIFTGMPGSIILLQRMKL